jgi:hypothetical protein
MEQEDYGSSLDDDSGSDNESIEHQGDDERKNKEKNKEHAKKTRIRRKYFIDTLKKSMKELCEQFEKDEIEMHTKLSEVDRKVIKQK